MTAPKALKAEELYTPCDVQRLPFDTTQQLEDLAGVVGQERALEATQFGIGVRREGYNLFVLGPPGHGKRAMIDQILRETAASQPVPSDWCYIYNFEQRHQPRVLQLPAGQGVRLRDDMSELVAELRSAIPSAFESEAYRTRGKAIEEEFNRKKAEALEQIKQEAKKNEIALVSTPLGFVFSPVKNGEVLTPEGFGQLSEQEQNRIAGLIANLEGLLEDTLRQVSQWRKERRRKIEDLNGQITTFAVGNLLDELKKGYADFSEVLKYLDAVGQDVIKHVEDFRGEEEAPGPLGESGRGKHRFRRYEVNLLVDHSQTQGAPIVYEDLPTHQNLIGRVEHESRLGTLVTDFTLIKPGALHKANGGYLVLDVQKLLMQAFAWEALKRSLTASEIRIDSLGYLLGLVSTVSLEPQPIPLDIKVVLLGDPWLYYLLYHYDPQFNELFKVAADFEEDMDRSSGNCLLYARLLATLVNKEGLRVLGRDAVGRVIEYSARIAGDAKKLSSHMAAVADLLREADYWAGHRGAEVVSDQDVQQAIDAQVHRADRLRDRLMEQVQRGIILIDTDGKKIAQVNALSVIDLGSFAFSRPSRITATARMGNGDVIDIEREVKLGGAIHSKGVLILSQFLASRYSKDRPLSLEASLVFEQSYGEVEGDSASLAELCALLSALSEVPIKQSLAVTGSVNQRGQVQPVGAVNEKIEGFFDVCRARGLTGDQGVLIPASNAQHLMLRHDVVEAAAAGRFHVYAVQTVDEAIEVLTDTPSGQPDHEGHFPEASVNHRVQARLVELLAARQQYSRTETENSLDTFQI